MCHNGEKVQPASQLQGQIWRIWLQDSDAWFGILQKGSPISPPSQDDDSLTPVLVKLSLQLFKGVAIKEEDNSIELQFQITLEWKENRASFQNLKTNLFLNDLSLEDISKLWHPLVIYTNTDKQETTRLGVEWEWTTDVS